MLRKHFKGMEEEKKKEETRELIIKYLELIIIFLVVIILVIMLRNWYRNEQQLKANAPVIRGVIAEINTDELAEYLTENEDPIFYICSSEEKKCRTFEKELKPFIEEHKLQTDITYLNITDVKNKTEYLKEFHDTYQKNGILSTYPAFVKFQDGKVESSIELTGDVEKIKEVENFLRVNGVIGE